MSIDLGFILKTRISTLWNFDYVSDTYSFSITFKL